MQCTLFVEPQLSHKYIFCQAVFARAICYELTVDAYRHARYSDDTQLTENENMNNLLHSLSTAEFLRFADAQTDPQLILNALRKSEAETRDAESEIAELRADSADAQKCLEETESVLDSARNALREFEEQAADLRSVLQNPDSAESAVRRARELLSRSW